MAVAMDSGCWRSPSFSGGKKRERGWGEDQNKLLEMMIGRPGAALNPVDTQDKITLDLLGGSSSSSNTSSSDLRLDWEMSAPSGWERRLDLKLGRFYYVNLSTGRSTYEYPGATMDAGDDLKLNLALGHGASRSSTNRDSIPTIEIIQDALNRSAVPARASPSSSAASSSVSTELRQEQSRSTGEESSAAASPRIVLTSCKRCLMYVMLNRSDPRCPKCKSSIVVDATLQQSPVKKPRIKLDLL